MKKIKKLCFSMGAIIALGMPISTIIACAVDKKSMTESMSNLASKESSPESSPMSDIVPSQKTSPMSDIVPSKPVDKIISQVKVDKFMKDTSTIEFEGVNGDGHVINNYALDNGLSTVTLKYGWTKSISVEPEQTVTDYKQIKNMSNLEFFTIDITANIGWKFEGEAPRRITVVVTGLALYIITKKFLDDFLAIGNVLEFTGVDGQGKLKRNDKIPISAWGLKFSYGWSAIKDKEPSTYIDKHYELQDLSNGYEIFVYIKVLNSKFYSKEIPKKGRVYKWATVAGLTPAVDHGDALNKSWSDAKNRHVALWFSLATGRYWLDKFEYWRTLTSWYGEGGIGNLWFDELSSYTARVFGWQYALGNEYFDDRWSVEQVFRNEYEWVGPSGGFFADDFYYALKKSVLLKEPMWFYMYIEYTLLGHNIYDVFYTYGPKDEADHG